MGFPALGLSGCGIYPLQPPWWPYSHDFGEDTKNWKRYNIRCPVPLYSARPISSSEEYRLQEQVHTVLSFFFSEGHVARRRVGGSPPPSRGRGMRNHPSPNISAMWERANKRSLKREATSSKEGLVPPLPAN